MANLSHLQVEISSVTYAFE